MTKPTKWPVHSPKTQISLSTRPVWSVFAVRMKKPWVFSYPLSAQQRLWSDWGGPVWSESSLGAQVILLVLSCDSSNELLMPKCLMDSSIFINWIKPFFNFRGVWLILLVLLFFYRNSCMQTLGYDQTPHSATKPFANVRFMECYMH